MNKYIKKLNNLKEKLDYIINTDKRNQKKKEIIYKIEDLISQLNKLTFEEDKISEDIKNLYVKGLEKFKEKKEIKIEEYKKKEKIITDFIKKQNENKKIYNKNEDNFNWSEHNEHFEIKVNKHKEIAFYNSLKNLSEDYTLIKKIESNNDINKHKEVIIEMLKNERLKNLGEYLFDYIFSNEKNKISSKEIRLMYSAANSLFINDLYQHNNLICLKI